jgi:acetyltransferase-like isoleucine patch superfamily enzyme
MKSALLAILRFFRVGKIVRLALEEERRALCEAAVTPAEGVRFGPAAIVHNPPERRARIRIGRHTHVDGELLCHDYGGDIEIGEYTYVGLGARVWSGDSVRIGSHVFLAHNVNVTDTNSHQIDAEERKAHYLRTAVNGEPFQKGSIRTAPVVIEDHAWINFGVGILKGVRIGEGAIVGAMSLVTKDVPPYTLVAGNPARVIRSLKGDTP